MLLYLDYLKGILPCRNPEETAAYYEEILLFPKEGARAFALGRSGHMEVVESSPVYAAGPTAFWVEANHVDHVYETLHAQSGLHLLVDLQNTYYGSREFQVTDPAGNIKMDKSRAVERIDGAVALVMALDRALRCSGTSTTSIYEDRGLLYL